MLDTLKVQRDFILDPSLVLYLPLYELDGAKFMSKDAYGHICTVTGALWRPYGRYFDGTNDIITFPVQAFTTTGYTVEIWIRVSSFAAYPHIISTDDATFRFIRFNNNGAHIRIENDGDTDNAVLTYAFSTNTWYHIVITDDLTTSTLYVNGNLRATDTMAGGNRFNRIGGCASRYLPGEIGELRLYKRVLTAPETQHNYLATKWRYR